VPEPPREHGSHVALALSALGVVYGDIGTSPLYAFRESFRGHGHELQVTEADILGVLSLIVWSLVVIISVKYVAFVLRADNQGEGGILAPQPEREQRESSCDDHAFAPSASRIANVTASGGGVASTVTTGTRSR
jgi:K+ transporter